MIEKMVGLIQTETGTKAACSEHEAEGMAQYLFGDTDYKIVQSEDFDAELCVLALVEALADANYHSLTPVPQRIHSDLQSQGVADEHIAMALRSLAKALDSVV